MSGVATIGHNAPPPYDEGVVATLEARVRELADAGGAWLELERIEDDEQAGKLNDFLAQARASIKSVEDARKEAKEPHLAAGKAIDTRFRALSDPLAKLGTQLKRKLDAFVDAKQRRLDDERRQREAEARKQAEEAARALREAETRKDVIAQARAEEAAKEAEAAAKAAAKPVRAQVHSATGGGKTMSARITYSAKVEGTSNLLRAIGRLKDDPESLEKLVGDVERLCTALRRRKDGPDDIPGVTWIENRSVA